MNPNTYNLGGDLPIRRLGFGAMRLCGQPGNFGPYPDWASGKRLIRRAIELGVNFIDTAHAYGPGWNESLIGETLADVTDEVTVATKGGVEKTAADKVFPDARPPQLRLRCEESLRRLRLDRIPLYQLHRPDPKVPFAESVGALAELRAEGKIQHVGLSNVSLDQVEEALLIVPIASVQNRFNLTEQSDSGMRSFASPAESPTCRGGPSPQNRFRLRLPSRATTASRRSRKHTLPQKVKLLWHGCSSVLHTLSLSRERLREPIWRRTYAPRKSGFPQPRVWPSGLFKTTAKPAWATAPCGPGQSDGDPKRGLPPPARASSRAERRSSPASERREASGLKDPGPSSASGWHRASAR